MGNKSSNNDDFSRNPNFNLTRHQADMRNIGANYTEANYQLTGSNPNPGRNVQIT